jgi:hypothetical protein
MIRASGRGGVHSLRDGGTAALRAATTSKATGHDGVSFASQKLHLALQCLAWWGIGIDQLVASGAVLCLLCRLCCRHAQAHPP